MKKWLAVLLASLSLSGCVLFVVGGAAMGLWIGSDPRGADIINSDFDLGKKLEAKISDIYKTRAHVNVNVFNGLVLMTGEVPDAGAKQQVGVFAEQMQPAPRAVYNEVAIAQPSTVSLQLQDNTIAAEVKRAILAETGSVSSLHIQVIVERQVVYLMGLSQTDLIDRAATAASKVRGVQQVVKLVEIGSFPKK